VPTCAIKGITPISVEQIAAQDAQAKKGISFGEKLSTTEWALFHAALSELAIAGYGCSKLCRPG